LYPGTLEILAKSVKMERFFRWRKMNVLIMFRGLIVPNMHVADSTGRAFPEEWVGI
jgi:hypothetical protein